MIYYSQRNGATRLGAASQVIGYGYSGHGIGLNNPAEEAVRGVGVIPRGRYRLKGWEMNHPHLGPLVTQLIPVGHNADGRTELFIHGDNAAANHTASDGCIILDHNVREALWKSHDMDLEVI